MNDNFMRFVLGLIVIIGLSMGGWQFWKYWGKYKDKDTDTISAPAVVQVSGDELAGLPSNLAQPLAVARQQGAEALHDFIDAHRDEIKDPRLAWIELDYVVLLAQASPGQARREFARIKSRVEPNSPVYPRIQQLSKTYE